MGHLIVSSNLKNLFKSPAELRRRVVLPFLAVVIIQSLEELQTAAKVNILGLVPRRALEDLPENGDDSSQSDRKWTI